MESYKKLMMIAVAHNALVEHARLQCKVGDEFVGQMLFRQAGEIFAHVKLYYPASAMNACHFDTDYTV